jgi:hypothetical protein
MQMWRIVAAPPASVPLSLALVLVAAVALFIAEFQFSFRVAPFVIEIFDYLAM